MCCTFINLKPTSDEQWADIRTLLSLLAKKLPSGADAALKAKCAEMMVAEEVNDDDEDAEELCNCQFTLAYGTKILLHKTKMRLKRGKKYGLLGGNDSGKTTLMRAIANGSV
ncbi:unnamed protein product [Scytosiphon promiscuus]